MKVNLIFNNNKFKTMEEQEKQNQNNSEPHVRIFGENISGGDKNKEEPKVFEENKDFKDRCESRAWRHQMRREWRHNHHGNCCGHHSSGIFGLAVLMVGVLLLLNSIGAVTWHVWNFIWPFWPALLIFFGLRLLFGHNWGAEGLLFLLGLALYAFIIIYVLIQMNSPWVSHLPPQITNFINNLKPFNL